MGCPNLFGEGKLKIDPQQVEASVFVVCVIKGKSSAWIKKKNKKIPKGSFWARGYFVSTIGINEYTLKKYIEHQQHQQVEPLTLPFSSKKQA